MDPWALEVAVCPARELPDVRCISKQYCSLLIEEDVELSTGERSGRCPGSATDILKEGKIRRHVDHIQRTVSLRPA